MPDLNQPHANHDQADRRGPQSELEHLTLYLADRDVPCPACGYNIRQLQNNTCPECGRTLKLAVGVENLSNTWIVALLGAVVPAACGFPFQMLFLFALTQGASFSDLTSEPELVIFLALILYTMLCVPTTITLLAAKRNFMRRRVQVQNAIASFLVFAAIAGAIVALALLTSL